MTRKHPNEKIPCADRRQADYRNSEHRSAEYRYTVAARDRQLALLQRDGSSEWRGVKLFEIAPNRLLLEIDEPLPANEGVSIKLNLNDGEAALECLGLVEWSQMSIRGDWWMSCELIESIPDRFIDRLAQQRLVERRQDPRFPIDLDAQVKIELSEEWTPAKLIDYSAGGFQVHMGSAPVAAGQRILLRVPSPNGESVDLAARVVWSAERESNSIMGCAFVHRHSYVRFRALLGLTGARLSDNQQLAGPTQMSWWSRLKANFQRVTSRRSPR